MHDDYDNERSLRYIVDYKVDYGIVRAGHEFAS